MKVYSFDIFDTCLVRKCGEPSYVFDLLAIEVLGEDVPNILKFDFANERIVGERKARKVVKNGEVNLEDIYEFCDFSRLTSISNKDIRLKELEIERKMLLPNRIVKEIISEKRKTGKVLFISDMYLSSSFLKEILQTYGFYENGDEIFVSGECGVTKYSGALYKYVAEKLNISSYGDWHHYGDNSYSDYKIPKRIGIKAHKLPSYYVYYESLLKQKTDFNQLSVPSCVAGVSRALRLSEYPFDKKIELFNLIAPLLVSNVYWILSSAEKKNISRLFFLARDGYVQYEIAKVFAPLFPKIEISYLHVSRSAIYFPCILDFCFESFKDFVNLIRDKESDFKAFFHKYCYDFPIENYIEVDKITTKQELFDVLLSREDVFHKLAEHQLMSQEVFLKYLESQGVAQNDILIGLVDLISGRMGPWYINQLINRRGYRDIIAYGFASSYRTLVSYPDVGFDTQFSFARLDGKYLQFIHVVMLIEEFFAATDQRRTLFYVMNDKDEVIPVCDSEQTIDASHLDVSKVNVRVYKQFAQLMIDCKMYLYSDVVFSTCLDVLCDFANNPDYRLVKYLGDTTVSVEGMKEEVLIRRICLTDVYKVIVQRNCDLGISWIQGAIVYTFSRLGNNLLNVLRKYKNVLIS